MRSTACESQVPSLARSGRQLAAAVDLLGDVGQVEVGAEGAHEPARGRGLDRPQLLDRRLPVAANQPAHPLDEVEQLLALLAHERLAEQRPQLTDVAPQLGLGVHAAEDKHAARPGRAAGKGRPRRACRRARSG